MFAKKEIRVFKISEKRKINNDFFIIGCQSIDSLPGMFPGQFVQVLVEEKNVFLRRPFSIHKVDYDNNCMYLLIQVVGKGTKYLSGLQQGDIIDIIFPLGNSFSYRESKKPLLIGGGCGIAPLLFLAQEMYKKGIKPSAIIGSRDTDNLLEVEEYAKYGNAYVTTEDGSQGAKGFVIHHPVLWDETMNFDKIFTCGPEPMLKAVAKYAKKRGVSCEVSLENTMACGIGACLCCVVETTKGHICTCTEGPVFNTNDLIWEI